MSEPSPNCHTAASVRGPWRAISGHAAGPARRRVAVAELRARIRACQSDVQAVSGLLATAASTPPASNDSEPLREALAGRREELAEALAALESLLLGATPTLPSPTVPWHRAPPAPAPEDRRGPAPVVAPQRLAAAAMVGPPALLLLTHLDVAWLKAADQAGDVAI